MRKFWRNSCILLAACLLTVAAQAQNKSEEKQKRKHKSYGAGRKGNNLPNYDLKPLHYGFFVAINNTSLNVKHSPYFIDQLNNTKLPDDSVMLGIEPRKFMGFTTGFILNVRLHDQFDFRLLPTVSFYQRQIDFRFRDGHEAAHLNQSTYSYMEFPLLVKYKSVRRGNTRMYIIGGIKPAFEIGVKREELDPTAFMRTTSSDFSLEYGFGFDLYYPMFKFSPEIRFSHGMQDIKEQDSNMYSRSVNKLTTHAVTFYLNFE
ncbi:Outer membrane protein beta-barrel domain-containing protein [Flexibacter flexilis DSM 6793]|uniref:Outer membrane protein beta-barrel domain-containing protein n=1 Tax=Flexibacter flexilis DSM 6793 TaxID=927664 RepID=A0A1I1J5M8_9BACT|nr:porin family protein [Flexibacter flexilis]SFC41908.1 Outer membrane protein beta-barrel domain-containing protein [Flexibacter flexilis DSM 6793]